jgi:hypothetical protein
MLTTRLLNLSFATCAPAWITPLGSNELIILVATLGFIASSFIVLKICLVSSVHTGKQFTSRRNFPAKVVFSVAGISIDAGVVVSFPGEKKGKKGKTNLELPSCNGVGIYSSSRHLLVPFYPPGVAAVVLVCGVGEGGGRCWLLET